MTKDKQVGWVITGVHSDSDNNRVGYGQGFEEAEKTEASYEDVVGRTLFVQKGLTINDVPYDKRVKWRSFSDDGDPAYNGVVHIEWLFPTEDSDDDEGDPAYNIDRFCMEDWGATCVAYNGADIKRCRPDLADFVDRQTVCRFAPNTTYFEIYG